MEAVEPCEGVVRGRSDSVVDYCGKKRVHFAVQQAFRPFHVKMDCPISPGSRGTIFRRPVHYYRTHDSVADGVQVRLQVRQRYLIPGTDKL